MNIPIILIVIAEEQIPPGLLNPRLKHLILFVRWEGTAPVGLIQGERLAATILYHALTTHLNQRAFSRIHLDGNTFFAQFRELIPSYVLEIEVRLGQGKGEQNR